MSNVDLSVIIPSKNNKHKTAEIIRHISENTDDLDIEFIVIDMNSSDDSVSSALQEIKSRHLKGCVIQSGKSTVSSALNTGIYQSNGKYITFVYPRKLYKDYMISYYHTIEKHNGDIVFAVPSDSSERISDELVKDHILNQDFIYHLAKMPFYIDLAAVMLRREYLLDHHIRFFDECRLGYAEAFIYNIMLFEPKAVYDNTELQRDYVNSMSDEETVSNRACMSRIDALIKVYEQILLCRKDDQQLVHLFEYEKIPAAVMSVVDILLKENFSCSAVKKKLHKKHYDEYLRISSKIPSKLRYKIFKWKWIPYFYKP